MGNRLCCGKRWSCPSVFERKKKTGSHPGRPLKQQQQHNGTKGRDTTRHTCVRTSEQPVSREKNEGLGLEDSSLHYADIQVCSRTQPRSAREVKHLQLQNATEYATLCFPQATPCHDSKNRTLV